GITGSETIILVEKDAKSFLWEPFAKHHNKVYNIERNIYKNIYGNKIIFEELNLDLGIKFQYGWYNSEKFGFIKKSTVTNQNNEKIKIEVLDGIMNILPYGIDYDFQNAYSNLLDAYKKNELIEESGLGLFLLSSIPVDKPEPSESLKATTVWAHGPIDTKKILLSNKQINKFKNGQPVDTEIDVRATRGSYFVNAELALEKNATQNWYIIAEINQESGAVADLNHFIKTEKNIDGLIEKDIALGTSNLIKIVANADGLQLGKEELCYSRHFSNTLFNVMRGGIFKNNYTIETEDFTLFVEQTNKEVHREFKSWLEQLPRQIQYMDLEKLAENTNNADLIRICYEYMPITFSRRHGDPSRPWNQFSIETKNADGSTKYNFQGNWRDIFQNWEALGLSYPEFVENMLSKFLNASTADGYNPYRITREGIDWECPDPNDPWAFIGYWGDHQIIYLQKFLELSDNFHPGKLDKLLTKEIFVYANVPYRIKSYKEIVKNPKDTIEFNESLNNKIKDLVKIKGADGRMLHGKNDVLYRANLTEKILVTLLAKISNFIPEAGIWLNTQRPEWNDANNALVGNGVSMVTLYYLRRFLKFWSDKFSNLSITEIAISTEVKTLFDYIFTFITNYKEILDKGFSDEERRHFIDALGEAGSSYRNEIYTKSFSGIKKPVKVKDLVDFCNLAIQYMDQSIKANKREDGLYHAYNLISISENSVSIRYLYEMLEGQVSVLSSGYLSAKESLDVLNSLKWSQLFRCDQYSYILYPDRQLPRFVEKNNIPEEKVKESELLSKLIADNNSSILTSDKTGKYHFNGTFRNADFLEKALMNLNPESYSDLVAREKDQVLHIFEDMFDHQSFTGRSGTFYGYEGLGSIYWHMVSKLLLAAQESYFKGVNEGADAIILGKIKDHYYEIKAGIGLYKSPELYGAFPTDAYSHTPAGSGAKQPGMTGQVKEDFISRILELGLTVKNGEIEFNNTLLNHDEFLKEGETFTYYNLNNEIQQLKLKKGQLGFTYCKIPIIYSLADKDQIIITYNKGDKKELTGNKIDKKTSTMIFNRSNEVNLVELFLKQ
ncbi:MAG: hypothetical protein P1P88_07260, partial [Bacteroidales bacterium]|nr:hypothetical protein [Bacteroidales bacterium]